MKRLILTCMCFVTMFMCVSDARAETMGTFATEIMSMGLSGSVGGMDIVVKESPTLQSWGETTVTDIGSGQYQVDSFFDVFTELSVDGGDTFAPSNNVVAIVLARGSSGIFIVDFA